MFKKNIYIFIYFQKKLKSFLEHKKIGLKRTESQKTKR